ncbi:MAG: PTS sugar transporter subunit IIB [Tyzzerella sp.]|uniref:PTS sugar transporter subunit IIB n=1 Tax=Candidatus Fimicola merdigallinarum TaxID=2840819 RepID=A0A9D9H4X8_9FIRM|nr:PTS sugar transporter subunit IIB [Candidatus Fimicola merdigallinarum]
MATTINILSICGSGTVTSSMVAAKLKDKLAQRGYNVTTTEARPTEALNLAQSGRFDILTHTSPLPKGDYGIPVVNAFSCVIGIGEDAFIDEVVEAIKSIGK